MPMWEIIINAHTNGTHHPKQQQHNSSYEYTNNEQFENFPSGTNVIFLSVSLKNSNQHSPGWEKENCY